MEYSRGPPAAAPPRRPLRPYPFPTYVEDGPDVPMPLEYGTRNGVPESGSDAQHQEHHSNTANELRPIQQAEWPLSAHDRPRHAPVNKFGHTTRPQPPRQMRRAPQQAMPDPLPDGSHPSHDWRYHQPPPMGPGSGQEPQYHQPPPISLAERSRGPRYVNGPPPAYPAVSTRQRQTVSSPRQRCDGRSQRSNQVSRNPFGPPSACPPGPFHHVLQPMHDYVAADAGATYHRNAQKLAGAYGSSSGPDTRQMRSHKGTTSTSVSFSGHLNLPGHAPRAQKDHGRQHEAQDLVDADDSDSSATVSAGEIEPTRDAPQPHHEQHSGPDALSDTGETPLQDQAAVLPAPLTMPTLQQEHNTDGFSTPSSLRQDLHGLNKSVTDSPEDQLDTSCSVGMSPLNTPEIREPEPHPAVQTDYMPESATTTRSGNDFLGVNDIYDADPAPLTTSKKSSKHRSSRLSTRWSAFWSARGSSNSRNSVASRRAPSPSPAEKAGPRSTALDTSDRASTSSLSDLIRRATKLATNLERGRTASRFGHSWFLDLNSEEAAKGKSEDEISTPSTTVVEGPVTEDDKEWPRAETADELSVISVPRRRQCCGMPVWAFTLLMMVILILTAAAVAIPVILLVVKPSDPSQR